MEELVSIAMCTYNGERNIEEQIQSILNQSYKNFELIIVDDVSTDSTWQKLQNLALADSRITILLNAQNLGYVKNFEKALLLCKGAYIFLSDQDDIWDTEKVKTQVRNIGDAGLIYHDSGFIDENGLPMNKRLSEIVNMYEGNLPHPFFFYNCISGHSMLIKKELLQHIIPFDNRFYHDWWIAFVAADKSAIKYIDLPLVQYRQHQSSNTDILKLRPKFKKKNKPASTDLDLEWISLCESKTDNHKKYLSQVLCHFKTPGIEHSVKLFGLLMKEFDLLFFIKKKSYWSKLNYIRKICFNR